MSSESQHHSKNNSRSGVSVAVPPLIKQVRDNALSVLSNQFNQFFSSCDTLFFELASRAGSNNEQNLYFDAMREIRLQKTEWWHRFKTVYERQFNELTQSRLQPSTSTSQTPASKSTSLPSLDSIGLVDKDDMEIEVAIASIVNRARADNQEQLYAMNLRFDSLLPDISVTQSNHPLDPAQLCNAVKNALSCLTLGTKSKLILLKHLDRTVVQDFKNLYALANDLLASAGVMPQIHYGGHSSSRPTPAAHSAHSDTSSSTTASRPHQSPASAQAGSPTSSAGTASGTLTTLQNLLQKLRQSNTSSNLILRSAKGSHSAPIRQAQLLDALSAIQLSSAYVESPQDFNIRSVVERILSERKEDALDAVDEDMVNLVSMFFDFVLDDRNLPVPFQALISRLQIPILKVALKDSQFFSNSQHPARRLINEIASQCVGWEDSDQSSQDHLYKITNRTVHNIIQQFTGDVALFAEELDAFQKAVKMDSNKAAILEKRTQEAAQGKAKAEHAREQVNQLLYDKLNSVQLPAEILDFLVQEWKKVLLYTYLKQGPESHNWLEAKQVIDQLIWSMRQHHDERSLARLQRVKEEVLSKVSHGLEAVSVSPDVALTTLSVVEQLFEMALQRRLEEHSLHSLSAEQAVALGAQPAGPSDWSLMTAVERQRIKMQTINKEFITRVKKIEPGTWLSYVTPSSGKTFRCKLALITQPGNTYVFVNRYGLRTFEKNLTEFADDFQQGYIEVLDNGVLFDRAMDNISGTLKKLAS